MKSITTTLATCLLAGLSAAAPIHGPLIVEPAIHRVNRTDATPRSPTPSPATETPTHLTKRDVDGFGPFLDTPGPVIVSSGLPDVLPSATPMDRRAVSLEPGTYAFKDLPADIKEQVYATLPQNLKQVNDGFPETEIVWDGDATFSGTVLKAEPSPPSPSLLGVAESKPSEQALYDYDKLSQDIKEQVDAALPADVKEDLRTHPEIQVLWNNNPGFEGTILAAPQKKDLAKRFYLYTPYEFEPPTAALGKRARGVDKHLDDAMEQWREASDGDSEDIKKLKEEQREQAIADRIVDMADGDF